MTMARTDRETSVSADEFVWENAGHTEAHRFLAGPITRNLKKAAVQEVLDLGCGNGAFSNLLAEQGFSVRGVDASKSGIELAQATYPALPFQIHDLAEPLPATYQNKFDAVISLEVIEHLLLPRKLLESAMVALRPGGLLIVTTPFHGYWKNLALAICNKFDDHWHPLRDYGHIKFFSRKTLGQLVEEVGFKGVQMETVGRVPALARSLVAVAQKPLE